MKPLILGKRLSIGDVVSVARYGRPVEIPQELLEKVEEGRRNLLRALKEGLTIYGVTTGVGALSEERLKADEVSEAQARLAISHSAGVGGHHPSEHVRASILVRLNTLVRGLSGVRPEVVRLLVQMLNRNVVPAVPMWGSVGASGDLAQLAHIALVLIGEGEAYYEGKLYSGREALARAGLKPLRFEAKEALSLINGTSFSAGIAALNIYDAMRLARFADLAASISAQALYSRSDPFRKDVVDVKLHPGQKAVGRRLRRLMSGSKLVDCKPKIQDAYSVRCVPQVHGAVSDMLRYSRRLVEREINSISDNPLVFKDGVYSGCNFHGIHISMAMDILSMALATLGGISERRINRLLDPKLNEGLPPFLSEGKAGDAGYMLAQYTAASLVAEMRMLSTPTSINSIPTSGDQEDYVSMSLNAALKARRVIDALSWVISIELLVATKAAAARGVEKLSGATAQHAKKILRMIEGVRLISDQVKRIRRWLMGF